MSSTFKTWLVPAVLALGLSGCVVVEDDGYDDVGTLAVNWSIIGFDDPGDCLATGSDRLELAIYDVFGDLVTVRYPYCEDFAISLSLEEGRYTAEATLVDRFNESVTSTRVIDDIDIIEDLELDLSIDFPPDTFL
jgi:hypothetical protein